MSLEREDQRRFSVAPADERVDDMTLIITCEHCSTEVSCGGLVLLVDLNDAATEHAEVCPGEPAQDTSCRSGES